MHVSRNTIRVLVSIVTLSLVPIRALSQDCSTGALRSTVLDPAGARIAQASVVVVNAASGARYSASSDSEGHFAIELLSPGEYSVRVEADGMSPQLTPQLHVDVGGTAEINFKLKVAGTQESLSVSAAPVAVETRPAAVSMLLDERSVNDFPLNGRRFSDLALFSPVLRRTPAA